MKRRILALLFCLVLLLSACGGTNAGEGGLLSRASGIDGEEVLLTVDGREVPAWRYLYWLTTVCDQIRTAWNDAGRTLDWQQTLSGEPLADYARRKALENTALYATVETMAEENGVTLTEEDQAQLDGEWQEKVTEYGSEEAYLQALERMGLGREEARALSEDACLYRKLLALAGDASSALYVSQEELDTFVAGREYLAASCILISTAGVAPEDSETLAAKKAQAETLFAQINGADGGAALFTQLAQTENDAASQPGTFAAGDGTLPQAAEEALQALEVGQWSGVVETEEGYYLLLRQETDSAQIRADCFDDKLLAAAQAADTQPGAKLETLSVPAFYDAVCREREAV